VSKLQENFLNDFKDSTFTANQVYKWYCEAKSNPERKPYRSEIYNLILDPLLHKGVLIKLTKGLYQVAVPAQYVVKEGKASTSTEDDWDSYIKSKLKRKEVI